MFKVTTRLLRSRGHNVYTFVCKSNSVRSIIDKFHAFINGIYSNNMKHNFSALVTSYRPDIVHVHNLFPLISPSILTACHDFGVPVVMTCHNYRLVCPIGLYFHDGEVCKRCTGGHEYWCILKNCRNKITESIAYAVRTMVARKLRLFIDNVTLFIFLSRFQKNQLVSAGISDERGIVIPNAVEIPKFSVDTASGKYIAYVGRISPEKGLDTLLSAAAKAHQMPIYIAGQGEIWPKLAKEISSNIKYLGLLSHSQLADFYGNARFVVVPSICEEPFGLVTAEAMSYGLPVIASDIGGLPELVDDGVTGVLFDPRNALELADKMKLLWNDQDLCRKMGQYGRDKAIREYSKDIYYNRLIATYEKAIWKKRKNTKQ